MKRYLALISFSLLFGCHPGGVGGPADAGADAPDDAAVDAGPCLHCADLLGPAPNAGDDARLCPESVPVWQALHDDCACDVEPLPPIGKGLCAGPCTYHPTDAGAWCDNLVQEPSCLACLAQSPGGCSGPRGDCLADKGAP